MDRDQIRELINRRRRQVLLHSTLYYEFNTNLISDSQWSEWALELEKLQEEYPDIAAECVFAEGFEGFEHSSGYNLPTRDPWAVHKAQWFLEVEKEKKRCA